jgi:hypothetical protein
MIHQAFLGKSFKNALYTYSRWACSSAAKIIITNLSHERASEEPQWWVEQAFVVTAGICLTVDIFHRAQNEPEVQEHLTWIERAIKTLEKWPTSSVANHGIRLLTSLLQEYNKKFEMTRSNPAAATALPSPPIPEDMAPASIAQSAETAQNSALMADMTMLSEPWTTMPGDFDMVGFEDLMDTLPLEANLDNNMFFENMLSLANSQFF